MKINKIYKSISGEVGTVIPQGTVCTIIRTQGCNLKCPYCDAPETQDPNFLAWEIPVDIIIQKIKKWGLPTLLTGGEPLLQRDIQPFIRECIINRIPLQIETNGTMPVFGFPREIGLIVDYKFKQPFNVNLRSLSKKDWVKFVVSNEKELSEALKIIDKYNGCQFQFAISPMQGEESEINTETVTETLIKNGIPVVLNVQLHKLIDMP